MNIQVVRDFRRLRHEMVETAIFGRGVRSELVLNAMRKVRREAFLPKELREFAYEDAPLPIEAGQTISQPFIVCLNLHQPQLEKSEILRKPRLERAIGVIYRPETERASHYFQAVLPNQFDEYIWLDKTKAITPFATKELEEMPDTYPFGL